MQDLAQVKEIISAALSITMLYHLPHGQHVYSGHVINLPQDVASFANSLLAYRVTLIQRGLTSGNLEIKLSHNSKIVQSPKKFVTRCIPYFYFNCGHKKVIHL